MSKRIITFLACLLIVLHCQAQTQADRIVGTYKAILSRNDAKIKVFKYDNGYRMQVCWLKETKNPDGALKTDINNPDASKRKTPMWQVVLIDKVTYEGSLWKNGRIYDPTSGRSYKVELRLDGKRLEVKGKLGPFSKCMYWTKIE